MKVKIYKPGISRKKALSILMAVTNGLNSLAPLAMPLIAVPTELPKVSKADDLLALSFNRGGQILDRLFFTTAYAAYTPDVSAGTVTNEVIDGGGTQDVHGTGSTSSVTVTSGTQNVYSGGSATSTTISAALGATATQNVSSGGTTTGTTINSGGYQSVNSSGSATSTTINSGGYQYVNSSGSATGTTINLNGSQIVSSGGSADSTAIHNGGGQSVFGSATNTTIDHGSQYVFGSASGTTMNGGTQTVYSGGIASVTTIISGGTQNVLSGGSATSTTVSGGNQFVYGSATDTTISGGTQYVYSGGSASDTTINSGGTQQVEGSATGTTINGGGYQNVYSGGSTASTTVNNSGTQYVYNGGSATGTTVNSGGTQQVEGSAASATINSGGRQDVNSGGNATSTTINSGYQIVYAGGSATTTTIYSGGLQRVNSGGSATGTTINSGGEQEVYGSATSTTINGSEQSVISGGSASDTTINSLGNQTVYSGGSTTGTTINGGEQEVYGGATSTTINTGGIQEVYGSATDTIVNSGGNQTVNSGGSASGPTINNSGHQGVLSGGSASGTTINSGGSQDVYGTASATTIYNSGQQFVYSGAIVTDTTVNSGGVIQMNSGAALSGTTSLNQGIINLQGASATYAIASLVVTGGGTVTLANGTTAGNRLNITNLSGGAKFVINTDLAHGQSDQINITSAANSQNTVQVAYDPGFATGQNVSGSAIFATVSSGNATFTAAATEHGAYRYTPTLSETTSGGVGTWSVTGLTIPSDGSSGASETMHTASDIHAGNLTLWRSENNNLTKRMGELRNAKGQAGEWARVYRGSEETVDAYGRSTTSDYTAIQGGYDAKHRVDGGAWHTGYALGYLGGNAALARGSGTYSSVTVGAYGSWLGDKGHYFDVIAKAGRMRTSYYDYLNDAASTRVDGSYANWGTSISAEYGYRKQLADNWYLEPQLEINLASVNSASYTTSDGTSVYNQGINSTVGRLGLAIGRSINQKNSFYVKTSIAREFSARSAVTMSTGGLTPVTLEQDLKQTWLEYALGLTTVFNDRTNGYMEISKTTGAATKTPWLFNAGVRMSF